MVFNIIEFIFHIDKYLGIIIQNYGIGVYALLFLIIFLETGLVITPFLPGDSLIFAAGAFAASGVLNVFLIFIILAIAAIIGDSVNYWIGSFFGEKVFYGNRFFKKEYLERANQFYEKYGGKTIVLGRFIPIIRTFVPFVAGVGKMNYTRFLLFNVIGGVMWVGLFVFAGYFFGGIDFVKNNFSVVIIVIVIISIVPIFIEWFRSKRRKKLANANF
jgi:membrane-associated protein